MVGAVSEGVRGSVDPPFESKVHFHGKTLRKHAYSNILKISPSKTESFQIKSLIFFYFFFLFFHISAQNIDCGYS